MEILILMLLFQVKHYYADFVIQTYQQTVRKGIYKDLIGISHSLDHVCLTLVVFIIFNFIHNIDPFVVLALALLEGIIHYHIDWAKVKFGSKDITKPIFWNQFGLDQLAHQLTYILIIWYLILL